MKRYDVSAEDYGTDWHRVDQVTIAALRGAISVEDRPRALPWIASEIPVQVLRHIEELDNFLWRSRIKLSTSVYFSDWSPMIIVGVVALAAVPEPSVRDWYSTYSSVPVNDAVERLTSFPVWPHDGRSVEDLFILNHTDNTRTADSIQKASRRQLAVELPLREA